jgi:beta-lactamase class D
MTKKLMILLFVVLFFSISTAFAKKWEEKREWKRFFDRHGVAGCFLVYDLSTKSYLGHNLKRAKQGFPPASTFKLFNSLAALESVVIENTDTRLNWDGVDRGNANWNRDQSLAEAFNFSTLWFYQEIARRIGKIQMRKFVERAKYGNRDIGNLIDRFWLDDGSLRITAKQQIEFLVRLHKYDLPFSPENIDAVKKMSILERTNAYILRGKMGSATAHEVAWLVGYVERGDNAYFFAMNIDTPRNEDAAARIAITQDILRELRLID